MLDRDRDGLLQQRELMGLARLMGFNFTEDDWAVEYHDLCRHLIDGLKGIKKKHTCKSVMPCEDGHRLRSFRVDLHSQPFAIICCSIQQWCFSTFACTAFHCAAKVTWASSRHLPGDVESNWSEQCLLFWLQHFIPQYTQKTCFHLFLMSWCFCATDYLPMRVQNRPWWFQVQQQIREDREENNCNTKSWNPPTFKAPWSPF